MRSHDCLLRLNETILCLENSNKTQNDVNTMYSSFVNNFKLEMNERLNLRRICLSDSVSSNKKQGIKKPWWTDDLSEQWNNICVAEKQLRGFRLEKTRIKSHLHVSTKTFRQDCAKD